MLNSGNQYHWTDGVSSSPQIIGKIIPLCAEGEKMTPRFEDAAFVTEALAERSVLAYPHPYGTGPLQFDGKDKMRYPDADIGLYHFDPATHFRMSRVLASVAASCKGDVYGFPLYGLYRVIHPKWEFPAQVSAYPDVCIDQYSDGSDPGLPGVTAIDLWENASFQRRSTYDRHKPYIVRVPEIKTWEDAYYDLNNIRRFWMGCVAPNVNETASSFLSRMKTGSYPPFRSTHLVGPIPADGSGTVTQYKRQWTPQYGDTPGHYDEQRTELTGHVRPFVSRTYVDGRVWNEEYLEDDGYVVLLNRHVWVNDPVDRWASDLRVPNDARHVQEALGLSVPHAYLAFDCHWSTTNQSTRYFPFYLWRTLPQATTRKSEWDLNAGNFIYGNSYTLPVDHSYLDGPTGVWTYMRSFLQYLYSSVWDDDNYSLQIKYQGVVGDTGVIHFPSDWTTSTV